MKDYFLTMQIREPEGDTTLEQFLSLAGEGLPPLKVWMVDHEDEDIHGFCRGVRGPAGRDRVAGRGSVQGR